MCKIKPKMWEGEEDGNFLKKWKKKNGISNALSFRHEVNGGYHKANDQIWRQL